MLGAWIYMKAICFSDFSGPEVLKLADVAEPEVRPADLLVRVYAAGCDPFRAVNLNVPRW